MSLRKIIAFAAVLLLAFISVFLNSCATRRVGAAGRNKLGRKTFVIIGASSGFGRGMAEELGRCKANVLIAARRGDLLNEIAANIRAAGGTAVVVTMDIS